MKKPKRADIDVELAAKFAEMYPKLAKKVLSQPVSNAAARQKIRKRQKQSDQKQSSITDSIYEELEQPVCFAGAEARRRLSDLVLEPLPKLAWTKALSGYNDARTSAENAMRRIWAGTEAARAGRKADPWLDVCLFKVRAGLIDSGSSEFLRCVQHAQNIGKAQWFIERLTGEFKNAKKRVPGASQFSQLRARVVAHWMQYGFWLMSDDLIARIAHVSRQAVAKAVKELALVKCRERAHRPIVKGLGKDGLFIFRQGYPPKS